MIQVGSIVGALVKCFLNIGSFCIGYVSKAPGYFQDLNNPVVSNAAANGTFYKKTAN